MKTDMNRDLKSVKDIVLLTLSRGFIVLIFTDNKMTLVLLIPKPTLLFFLEETEIPLQIQLTVSFRLVAK